MSFPFDDRETTKSEDGGVPVPTGGTPGSTGVMTTVTLEMVRRGETKEVGIKSFTRKVRG